MQFPLMIGHEELLTGSVIDVFNPYSHTIAGCVSAADPSHVELAVRKAVAIRPVAARLKTYQKAEALRFIGSEIRAHGNDIAETIVHEVAKPIRDAKNEVERAATTFLMAASVAETMDGTLHTLDIHPSSANRTGLSKRFPLGVVCAITPFNFPLNLVAHKIAPALAMGNSVILKPSSQAPITALRLGRIVAQSGLPDGMLSVLPGPSSVFRSAIEDDRIQMISFTGSPETGWELKRQCGRKRIALELGGNAAVIIDGNAQVDHAVRRCVVGAFSFAGQVCISVQRILVHQSLYEPSTLPIIEQTNRLRVGDPALPETDVGPMIDLEAAVRLENWIEEALGGGGRLLTGGSRDANRFQPTLLENVPHACTLYREEAFGPVAILESFDSFDQALEITNDSRFGLQAGVFTSDIDRIWRAYQALEVGGVIVNDVPTIRVDNYPYGGIKESGMGREGVRYAMEEMSELKMLVLTPVRPG